MKRFLASALLCGVIGWGIACNADEFRRDINPALLYYQGFSLRPELSPADHDYLFTNEWAGRVLDDRFSKLISGFDPCFKLFRRAAKSEVTCDWGIDLTDGPHALLPGLAKAKLATQTARLRVHWHLQKGRPQDARDDLLAAFAMGRNLSTDRVLISTLVQLAIEHIVASSVAENFYQFSPDILRQIGTGLQSAPKRGRIVDTIDTENNSFAQYYLRTIEKIAAETPEGERIGRVRALLTETLVDEEGGGGAAKAAQVIEAGGGTIEGVSKLFQALPPLYNQVAEILILPAASYVGAMASFNATVAEHPNPLVRIFFPLFDNCARKEFAAASTVAMVQAAIQYKLQGMDGFKTVLDPCTGETFEFSRFTFEGVDRGFRLRSKFRGRDFDEALIFVEKPGVSFRVSGKNAGQKLK